MKKLLSFVLAVAMLVTLVPTSVFATETDTLAIKVGSEAQTLKPGEEIVLPITITSNPGISTARLKITYDSSVFELVSLVAGDIADDTITLTADSNMILWNTATQGNTTKTGVLCTLTLKVNSDAAATEKTEVSVTYYKDEDDVLDWDDNNITLEVTSCAVSVKYETTGLSFVNGNSQTMTYDEAKAEALGTGSLTKPDEESTYYFAGWFTGLSEDYKDTNGFYVIAPETSGNSYSGTELRPRYDTPPTEGTYNALWIKDMSDETNTYNHVMAVGSGSFSIYYNSDADTVLGEAITGAAGTDRTKLLHDLTVKKQNKPTVSLLLDLNGCEIYLKNTSACVFDLTSISCAEIDSGRIGGTINGGGYCNPMIYASGVPVKFTDITLKNTSANGYLQVGSATFENCVIDMTRVKKYAVEVSSGCNATFNNCKVTNERGDQASNGGLIQCYGTVTISNCTMTANCLRAPFSGNNSGSITFGAGNTVTATSAPALVDSFASVSFTDAASSYQVSADGTAYTNTTTVTGPVEGQTAGVDEEGYIIFGIPCTVTYKTFDGLDTVYTVSVMQGANADLTKTWTYNEDDVKYKHGGWALEANSYTALTSYVVNADTTLYATLTEAGPILGDRGEATDTNYTAFIGSEETSVTIQNANKLCDMDILVVRRDMYIDSSYCNDDLNFSAEALDSIANLVESEATFTVEHTVGTDEDDFVAKLDMSVMEGEKEIDFTGAVTVKIYFTPESGTNYRVYRVNDDKSETGLGTTVSGNYATFTTTHFSTYVLREVEVANGYTAGLYVTEDSVRAGGNTVNVTVDVTHFNSSAGTNEQDTTFNAAEIVVNYDPSLLTFAGVTGENGATLEGVTYKVDGNTLTIEVYGDAKALGTGVFTLQFTTCDSVTADTDTTVTLKSAAFADSVDARSENLITATRDPASDTVTIQLEAFKVTVETNENDGDTQVTYNTEAVKGKDYTFTVTKDEHYTYEVKATVGDEEVSVTESTTEPGKYTIAGTDVTDAIAITVEATANSYDVTFSGETPANNDGTKATHDTDYHFTLPTIAQHQVSYAITIGSAEYNGATATENVITIPGSDITGAIEVTISKEQTEFNMTVNGSDYTIADEDGDNNYEKGEDVTITIDPAEGYTYTVTAVKTGTEETVTVTDNGDNTYTIADIQNDLTITVTKSLVGSVAITEYLTLDGDNTDGTSSSMFLVIYEGTLADNYIPFCNGNAMYWSEKYGTDTDSDGNPDGAYCYLVIDSTKADAETNTVVSVASGTKTAISYTCNVNGSTNTDAADAQLVYDMYQAMYSDFDTVELMKFLLADINGDAKIYTDDAAAIISEILDLTTITA